MSKLMPQKSSKAMRKNDFRRKILGPFPFRKPNFISENLKGEREGDVICHDPNCAGLCTSVVNEQAYNNQSSGKHPLRDEALSISRTRDSFTTEEIFDVFKIVKIVHLFNQRNGNWTLPNRNSCITQFIIKRIAKWTKVIKTDNFFSWAIICSSKRLLNLALLLI